MSSKKNNAPSGGSGLFQNLGSKVLNRFSAKADKKPEETPEKETVETSPPPRKIIDESTLDLCSRLEEVLSLEDHSPPWPQELLKFVLSCTNLSWAFLTEIITGDPKHFVFLASQPAPPNLAPRQPMISGLAGYVHSKLLPLAVPSIKEIDELDYIFHPGEPLKKAVSFYGWPIIYNSKLRGALLLVGKAGQLLTNDQLTFIDHVVLRLTSQYQLDKLTYRVVEQNHLDPQTVLPHRTYFIKRLGEFINANKDDGVVLSLLSVSGLGRFALAYGQREAAKLLKGLAENLLENSGPDWELAHLSYGLFAAAAPTADEQKLNNTIISFQKCLSNWPIPTRTGRASFIFHRSNAIYPKDGLKPEMLVEVALSNLAQAES
ncbi:MAG: hypothetical protein LBJ64_02975 [Deltaproteobacteria bacterium]|nr:hypothetical protein [Deltaproteobacteria bacterium]